MSDQYVHDDAFTSTLRCYCLMHTHTTLGYADELDAEYHQSEETKEAL